MAGFVRDALLPLFLLWTTLPLGAQALATAPTEGGVALSFPTNEQLRRFKSMSGPRLAPDGKRILLSTTEATADGAKSHLWLTGAGGEEPRQITYSPDALPPKDEAAQPEDPPSSDTPQHPKSDAKADEVSLDVTRYKVAGVLYKY
jgi:hypothetical protein